MLIKKIVVRVIEAIQKSYTYIIIIEGGKFMPWTVIVSISVPVVLLFLYIVGKHIKLGKVLEGLSVFLVSIRFCLFTPIHYSFSCWL